MPKLLQGKLGFFLSLIVLKIIGTLQRLGLKRSDLAVLTYHKVVSHAPPYLPGEFCNSTFDWQIRLLKTYFSVLSLSTAIELMNLDKLPPLAVAITFDDGYKNNFTEAMPILRNYRVPATIFIATRFINGGAMWNDVINECIRSTKIVHLDLRDIGLGSYSLISADERVLAIDEIKAGLKYVGEEKRRQSVSEIQRRCNVSLDSHLMMGKEELYGLSEFNIDIGAHSVSHPILSIIPDEEARQEISNSKLELERLSSIPVRFFAYPNGKPQKDFNDKHTQMVAASGYLAAFSSQYGTANKSLDQFALPRISVWGENAAQFILHIVRAY